MADQPKDFWDKIHVLLAPVGGLLTALAVTLVGVAGSRVIDRRQAAETNARLYSELMSRREESESSLRKDMFVSIIQSFLQPQAGDDLHRSSHSGGESNTRTSNRPAIPCRDG